MEHLDNIFSNLQMAVHQFRNSCSIAVPIDRHIKTGP